MHWSALLPEAGSEATTGPAQGLRPLTMLTPKERVGTGEGGSVAGAWVEPRTAETDHNRAPVQHGCPHSCCDCHHLDL